MVKQRDDGFYKETASLVPHVKWVGDVQTDQLPVSVFSAQLARILHEQYNGLFQSVYVSQGHLPQVCLALNKLKLSERIAVFGYENPKQNNAYIKNGMIAAYIEQDTYRQGSCCIYAAYAYLTKGMLPDNRRLYVPSHLYQPAIQSDSRLIYELHSIRYILSAIFHAIYLFKMVSIENGQQLKIFTRMTVFDIAYGCQ